MWLEHGVRRQDAAPQAVTSDELPPLLQGDDQPPAPTPNGKRLTATGSNCVSVSLRPSALSALDKSRARRLNRAPALWSCRRAPRLKSHLCPRTQDPWSRPGKWTCHPRQPSSLSTPRPAALVGATVLREPLLAVYELYPAAKQD